MTQKLAEEKLVSLITEAQKGDCQSFNLLVQQFQNLAVGYAYTILRNLPLAEEAAQEAFIEAYLNLDRLRKPIAFPGWLKKIVFKQCDRIIRKKRHVSMSLEQSGDIVSSAHNPTQVIEQRELQQTVRQIIEQLPKAEREVITLFYLGERSYKEIAAWLEIPVTTVKNRLFTARKKLKTNFNPMVEDYLYNQRPSQDKTFAERVECTIKAACDGDETTMQSLLQQDAHLANAKSQYIQTTPLTNASHRGYLNLAQGAELDIFSVIALNNLEQINSLVTANSEVLQQRLGFAQGNMQPLHYAIELHKNEIAAFLIQKGAELQGRTRWGITPLCMAREKNNQAVIQLLSDRAVPEDLGALLVARQWRQAESMVKNQPDLIVKEALLIHYLIRCGLSEATAWLIDRNADLEIRTKYTLDDYVANLTPLQGAIAKKQVAIAQLLIENGAEINSDRHRRARNYPTTCRSSLGQF